MKKSLIILFPALVAVALGGCHGGGGEESSESSTTSTTTTSASSKPTSSGDPTTPTGADQHVTGINIDPTKNFMTQVGLTRLISVSFNGSPTDPTEKAVKWEVDKPSIAKIELVDKGYYTNANVTFLTTGTVKITVTSQYNTMYKKSVEATVVDNDEYTYLWNCAKDDKGKFTTIDASDPVPIVTDDNVELNGATWNVKRYAAYKSAYGSQTLQFGYGSKENGEGQIDFTLANSKEIEFVEVGCSSKAKVIGQDDQGHDITEEKGSSKISISVGGTSYLTNGDTVKGDNPEKVRTPARNTYASGNVVISFSASVGYTCVQYIYIKYTHYVESIEVTNAGYEKREFEVGEEFSSEGINVLATYSNDLIKHDVSSSVTVTPIDLSTVGEKTVNVSYTESGKTVNTTYKVNVTPHREITSVTLLGSPTKTEYLVGETMSYAGVSVHVEYDDSSTTELNVPTHTTTDFTVVNVPVVASLSMNEDWKISLTYKGHDTSLDFAAHQFDVKPSQIAFAMKDYEYGGYKNYVNLQDSNSLINIHIAAQGNTEQTDLYPAISDNHSILITTLNNKYTFKDFTFEFIQYTTSSGKKEGGTISVKQSVFGDVIFEDEPVSSGKIEDNPVYTSSSLKAGCNGLEISFSNQNHFGIVSLSFTLVSTECRVIDSISYTGDLVKTVYIEGELFSPTGLAFTANFSNAYLPEAIPNPSENITWEPLIEGMTSVEGTFRGKTVTVTGITVDPYIGHSYSKVTSNQDDFTGIYVIGSVAKSNIWNGSLSKSELKGDNNFYDVTYESGNLSLIGNAVIDAATFTITKQPSGNYFIVSASGFYCGLTAGGSLQVVDSNATEVAISIDSNGNVIITNESAEQKIACNKTSGKYYASTSGSTKDALIQLFKLDEF